LILSFPTKPNLGYRNHDYVALKVYVDKHRQAQNEKKVYEHLDSINSAHPGMQGIRVLRDGFQLLGKNGPHECLIHEPLGLTVKEIRQMSEGEKVSVQILKPMINELLTTLNFLHTEARVVHTGRFSKTPLKSFTHSLLDIQEGSIMIGVDDDTIFKTFVQEELAEPSLREVNGDRIIYATRQVEIPDNPSHFILCDFGDAQYSEKTYIGEVMPDLYRAPEIVLGIEWNEKIDIWSVSLMVSEISVMIEEWY
jgi:serine/threonine-protein kinase SRPK3